MTKRHNGYMLTDRSLVLQLQRFVCADAVMSAVISQAFSPEHFSFHGLRRDGAPIMSQYPILSLSSSLFGRGRHSHSDHRRRHPDRDVELSISIADLPTRASSSVARLLRSSESRFRGILSSAADAYDDLRTSVRIDRSNRIVFSCRKSSLVFVANLLFWGFMVVLAARVLTWVWWRVGFWGLGDWWVVKRDRSLGGREVVVGRRGVRVSMNPLSPPSGRGRSELKMKDNLFGKPRVKQENLPAWWPEFSASPIVVDGKEEFQREANRLVRAIMDNRMSGKDYKEDDIIQLRQICRVSGAKVSFQTANARDSFYRAAVEFVLSFCSRHHNATVQIDGEEVRQFISGLAGDIGLENIRAARLVRAGVAARTRSCFLQSLAFEIQGKRSEAMEELAKICQIHQIFPYEIYSPEMEMVASGLKQHLRIEQRKHLLKLFVEVCGAHGQKIAEEALDLVQRDGS